MATVNVDGISVKMSGLAEPYQERVIELLKNCRNKTPPFITNSELTVRVLDPTPVAYRPRHLAYAERVRVKAIIDEMIRNGIVRESFSEYASPIVWL